jgi:hypothetical protein
MSRASPQLRQLERLLRDNRRAAADVRSRLKACRRECAAAREADLFRAPPPHRAYRATAEPARRGSPALGIPPGTVPAVAPGTVRHPPIPRNARPPRAAASAVPPPEPAPADLVPAADGDATLQAVAMPQIRRTTTLLQPDLQTFSAHRTSPTLPRTSYSSIQNFMGLPSLREIRRGRREKRYPKTRAFFAVAMVLLLALILFRMIT